MQRKYIYILVVILTISLVTISHYFEKEYLEEDYSKEEVPASDIIQEDAYQSIEVSSPLVIKNFQNDDRNITYHYKITIENAVGAYRYIYNSKESYLVFTAIGEANIYLKSNESITIYNLPKDAKYKIEQVTDVSEYYTTSIDKTKTKIAEGTLSLENDIEFANETIIVVNKPNKNDGNETTGENNSNDSKNPEEEGEIIVDKNPVTKDLSTIAIICFIFATIVFISIRKIKIKRFE